MSMRTLRPVARSLASLRAARLPARITPSAIRATTFIPRGFSSTPFRSGSGESDSSLAAALASEHAYELESASETANTVPEFLEAFQAQGIWEIVDTPGSDDVSVVRRFGNETIKLTFQVSDLVQEEEAVEAEVPTPEETPLPTVLTCSLLLTKSAGPNALAIDLTAGEDGFAITNVAIFEKGLAELDGPEGDWQRRSKYMGPEFDFLDTTVQEAFADFLKERGIDDSLSNFLISYCEHKEQTDYVSWLKDVKAFVKL
ncbi:hypothetical protein P7C73_g2733, partial [Tremellales sp. Uapishka_1]